MLVAQSAWQVGVQSSTPCRQSHLDLADSSFGYDLLRALQRLLASIESSWQNSTALRIIISLTTRLLSLAISQDIHKVCYDLLQKARIISLAWAREIIESYRHRPDQTKNQEFHWRICEAAALCQSTFDIEDEHLLKMQFYHKEAAIITECCISINEHRPVNQDMWPSHMTSLLLFHDKICHKLEQMIRDIILNRSQALDSTLARIWTAYTPSGSWDVLAEPNERWLVTQTALQKDAQSRTVHYNLLTGTLFFDGNPLSRLPQDYHEHRKYVQIFGEVCLQTLSQYYN